MADDAGTVIAERIGWERSLTVLRDRVAALRPVYLPPDPASRTGYVAGEIGQHDFWFPDIGVPALGERGVVVTETEDPLRPLPHLTPGELAQLLLERFNTRDVAIGIGQEIGDRGLQALTATASGTKSSSVTVTMEPPEKMISASPLGVPGEIY